ncbi:MAG TPA: 4-alpha-glucanotransferase [Spirochaetia bacterium]|nr:4-alpha-glucanotransferase [Spirochaetia bacterium]
MFDANLLGERASGLLLHPSSLPGRFGIGDMGPSALRWVDALADHHQRYWQILPLGPTGYGNSPYQSFSAFAGNLLLLSPELLAQDGVLSRADLEELEQPAGAVDYERVAAAKQLMLRRAWTRFSRGGGKSGGELSEDFLEFISAAAPWLEDFALFMAVKSAGRNRFWVEWDRALAHREVEAIHAARRELAEEIALVRFGQFIFFRQWNALKAHAHAKGIAIIGDLPIFVAADSADVWSRPELFDLDPTGRPHTVAGVPPDYFSRTGQRWGNPLYRWDVLADEGFEWWHNRIIAALESVDILRIDHFRGFAAYWEVKADSADAANGRWVTGPGARYFASLTERIGRAPLIAEDLGWITDDVDAMRLRFGFPGMRVLQFAFAGATEARFLPYRYEPATVVYTGTHDNDTTQGWFGSADPAEKKLICSYLDSDGTRIHRDLIRLAWSSVANLAIAPLQDVLGLGSEARMNIPGTTGGNWCWRATDSQTTSEALGDLGEITRIFGRSGA